MIVMVRTQVFGFEYMCSIGGMQFTATRNNETSLTCNITQDSVKLLYGCCKQLLELMMFFQYSFNQYPLAVQKLLTSGFSGLVQE